jgi:hypothetical protein
MEISEVNDLVEKLVRARDKIICRDFDEATDALEAALAILFAEQRKAGDETVRFTAGSITQWHGDSPPSGWEWWKDAPLANEFGVLYQKPIWIIKTGHPGAAPEATSPQSD